MHVIGASRDGWAQVVSRDVPVRNAVERFEQGAVEHPHGVRVGEVDALFAVRVDDHELAQFGAHRDQLREVVTALMAIARVQARFDPRCGRLGFAGRLGFVACGFGSAWGCHVQFIPQKQSRASPEAPTGASGLARDQVRSVFTGWKSARAVLPTCSKPVRLRPIWRVPCR